MGLMRRFKGRYCEPYRIRMGYGLSPIRNQRELKALVEFCREELKERYYEDGLNKEKKLVLINTIALYEENDSRLYYHILNNAGYYWS